MNTEWIWYMPRSSAREEEAQAGEPSGRGADPRASAYIRGYGSRVFDSSSTSRNAIDEASAGGSGTSRTAIRSR